MEMLESSRATSCVSMGPWSHPYHVAGGFPGLKMLSPTSCRYIKLLSCFGVAATQTGGMDTTA